MRLLISLLLLISVLTSSAQSFFTSVSGTCATDGPVELATKFRTSKNGQITALRFYKCVSGGTYILKLYQNSTLVTSISYAGSGVGWHNVPINPVSITPDYNYTVAYYAANSRYQFTGTYVWPVFKGAITATGSAFRYGAGNTLPTDVYQSSNYFADVVFQEDQVAVPDTVYVRDTVEVIKWDTVYGYHDVDTVWINNYIRDTITIHDTIWQYLPQVCPNDTIIYLHDTVRLQCSDTTHVLFGYDALDSTLYDLPHYSKFKVFEYTTFDGKKVRYRHFIDEAIIHEEYDEVTGEWKRVVNK